MERYIEQLLADIAHATANVDEPYREREVNIWDWKSDKDGKPYDYGLNTHEDDDPADYWKHTT